LDIVLSNAFVDEDTRDRLVDLEPASSFRIGGILTNLERSATTGSIRVNPCLLSSQGESVCQDFTFDKDENTHVNSM